MNQKKYVQLVDELMTVVQVMDELYRYHPNNPNKVNVENEYKQMASRKKEIEAKLDELDGARNDI